MTGLVSQLVSQVGSLGILFPESLVRSHAFGVLAAFVAINTVIYVALSVAKALPKIYVRDHLPRTYERAETRSIHPDAPR
ncbi:hypothetical protein ACFJIY_23415 [Pimelobacter simplex]|uniref:Uncharacterized protein n=1 Tax=Nocardioides simplex TaxID=2045 RepID=A0A0A1DRE4_NOCSI|nr:hypothetical protein [Pimelobacter simplex]AIY19981.2 hypothetical protein KR76_16395 [Pimelobacter simplex]GEB16988.1 hypothetical protein NSI01_53030 [Pimelobacter simplex]SFM75747.1 hypothetical protein SAMN05421671_3363 [Pimelobacter simplex]